MVVSRTHQHRRPAHLKNLPTREKAGQHDLSAGILPLTSSTTISSPFRPRPWQQMHSPSTPTSMPMRVTGSSPQHPPCTRPIHRRHPVFHLSRWHHRTIRRRATFRQHTSPSRYRKHRLLNEILALLMAPVSSRTCPTSPRPRLAGR